MPNATDVFQAQQWLANGGFFENWISLAQRQVLKELIKGEEGAHFLERLQVLKRRIEQMPVTYGTSEQDDPIGHLKYFGGPVTAYILEKDVGDNLDGPWTPDTVQIQALGRICVLPNYPEVGYVCIQELIEAGVELDLDFEPEELSKIKAKES